MAEFRFTNEHRASEAANIGGILRQPRLWIPSQRDYPDFSEWVDRTEAGVVTGNIRAMLAYTGAKPSGVIIYRKHEHDEQTVEIRNISVSPDAQGRYIGSFLLRNVEIEATQHDFPRSSQVQVDTKLANSGMIDFLADHGYGVETVTDLYGLGAGVDAVLKKVVVTA